MKQWCFEVLPPHKTVRNSDFSTRGNINCYFWLVRSGPDFNEGPLGTESGTETNLLHIAIIGTYKDNTFIKAQGQSVLN